MPDLVEVEKRYAEKDVTLALVSLDGLGGGGKAPEAVLEFSNSRHLRGQPLYFRGERGELRELFGLGDNIPLTVILNEHGDVVESHLGPTSADSFSRMLDRALDD